VCRKNIPQLLDSGGDVYEDDGNEWGYGNSSSGQIHRRIPVCCEAL